MSSPPKSLYTGSRVGNECSEGEMRGRREESDAFSWREDAIFLPYQE